jgi:hypothetical protein
MNKTLLIIQFIAVGLLLSTASYASGGDRGHHRGHRKHYNDDRGYYPRPQPGYYGPQHYQDPRSHQGLAGGVVGSVLGYEIGKGDPIATGLGAAAGSFIGNGISGRR